MTDAEKKPETLRSTDQAYRVEIRATGRPLIDRKGHAIGNEWQPLPEVTVPPPGTAYDQARETLTGTHDYYGAIALACSFLSGMGHFIGAEVRLIQYKREIEHKLTEQAVMPLPNELDELFARAGAAKRHESTEERG